MVRDRQRWWAKLLLAGGSIALVAGFTLLLTSIAPMFGPRAELVPTFTPSVTAPDTYTVIAPTASVPGPVPGEVAAPAIRLMDSDSFEMRIPVLGFSAMVHQGVSLEVLARGAGHYPGTPWPGQPGNVGVAGHNALFLSFSRLVPGDRVEIRTQHGLYIYEIAASEVVSPTDSSVLAPTRDNRLTLTTCYPLWAGAFATQRLIFTAREIGGVA